MMLAIVLDSDDWQTISALATLAGTVGTFLAIGTALFGEQLRHRWMKPKLVVSCGTDGILLRPHDNVQTLLDSHMMVTNYGRTSARNILATLNSVHHWNGLDWETDQTFLPIRLLWRPDNNTTLNSLAPDSFSLLHLGVFFDPAFHSSGGEPCFSLSSNNVGPELLSGRHKVEIVITSDNAQHYRGFFEIAWDRESFLNVVSTLSIRETQRVVGDDSCP